MESLEQNTCMSSLIGMCKRVLKDIEQIESKVGKTELENMIANDRRHGGMDYRPIYEIASKLKELEK